MYWYDKTEMLFADRRKLYNESCGKDMETITQDVLDNLFFCWYKKLYCIIQRKELTFLSVPLN